ncbi:hypothetical protein Syun_030391 [Stephania yunnanensis]|uniref:Uncharacterized protein n=1 Tax=Stephania yunnanensis TaxID=152371 RepID=A0AAP0EAQ0_9MAGN
MEDDGESEDFEEHLRHISLNSKKGEKSVELPELDEALDKSKYRDGLRAVRKYIPRLEQDLELLKEQAKLRYENKAEVSNENKDEESSKNEQEGTASRIKCTPDELGAMIDGNDDSYDEDSVEESGLMSDSEPLSICLRQIPMKRLMAN